MPFDEGLAQRLRDIYADHDGVVEKKMFGGLAFMVRGNMSCGVIHDRLMVRVGPELYADALSRPHAAEMDFTGRPMKGFVKVEPQGFETDDDLRSWADLSLQFVRTLPAK